jgi:arylsulfatase
MSRFLCGIVSLVLCALTGCAGPTEEELRETVATRQASCIVVVLAAAGAGHVGTYGYAKNTTPNVDRLAAAGVVFERAYSPGASKIVSIPAMFAGRYPQSLIGGAPGAPKQIMRAMQWILARQGGPKEQSPLRLAAAFREAGFRTAGFSENVMAGPTFGLAEGFEKFEEIGKTEKDGDGSAQLLGRLLDWLLAQGNARTFAYLHLLRPHSPYLPPADIAAAFRPASYTGRLRADTLTLMNVDFGHEAVTPADVEFLVSQYDANLFYADKIVGALLEGLRAARLDDRTVVIVTADHGEAFGEHGRYLHNSTLYQEMIHVPFVVHFPPDMGVRPARVPTPTSLVDVLPTLQALFTLVGEGPPQDGRSLLPALLGRETNAPPRSVFAQAGAQVAVLEGDFKYIYDAKPDTKGRRRHQLYNLRDDPGERNDLSAANPPTVTYLRSVATKFLGHPGGADAPR